MGICYSTCVHSRLCALVFCTSAFCLLLAAFGVFSRFELLLQALTHITQTACLANVPIDGSFRTGVCLQPTPCLLPPHHHDFLLSFTLHLTVWSHSTWNYTLSRFMLFLLFCFTVVNFTIGRFTVAKIEQLCQLIVTSSELGVASKLMVTHMQ